jgi:Fe-S cluster assembly iron-binding protein IscA
MIHVTETAAEKINALLAEENKIGAGLREAAARASSTG